MIPTHDKIAYSMSQWTEFAFVHTPLHLEISQPYYSQNHARLWAHYYSTVGAKDLEGLSYKRETAT